jgi:DNA primase
MTTLMQHLEERHLDVALHQPVLDLENDVATFYLWNLSGALVGFQQYRRTGDKKTNNNPRDGKYFTYSKQPTLAVWGVESLHLTPNVVFVTEGVFDAARLTKLGYSALAVLCNNPTHDLKNWLNCLNRKVVVVADNDHAGRRLAKFGHVTVFTEEKDLGESSDEFVQNLVAKFA